MELKQAGPWEIDKKLGAGGMGTVYLGKHTQTGQIAAIKVLPLALAKGELGAHYRVGWQENPR